MAEYSFTGTFTRPKAMDPVQIALITPLKRRFRALARPVGDLQRVGGHFRPPETLHCFAFDIAQSGYLRTYW
ncbi:hypothetical protein GCM10010974_12070 [Brevibacterium sediminis]|uniref:Uncharacterized protein n=1 Tax=Brevibacterium sediminis TaxID=1857024 RepID=A0ABQ1LZE2_9MICO|nr:hypothetical protein GCM10010974_12070 [Brevibacterium sediminis]